MGKNWMIIIFLLGLLFLAVVYRPTQVIVNDSPVKFSSVRKHPFDVYADPYHPPERDNPYVLNSNYQQVGFLQGQDRAGMLPLFGRPNPHNKNKWDYYTMTDGIKLPIGYRGRKCQDNGCDEINTSDELNVMGLGKYKSQLYDTKDLTRF
ncbi:hypothetical protein EB118_04060 [bacterium]|nr:hypothetical protein [Actinomycetota bacterium]NDG29261.1 hypothetical protein [bacterium]